MTNSSSNQSAGRQSPVRPGSNSLITRTPFGTVINGRPHASAFGHPFQPFLSGTSIRFSAGYVNSEFVPIIRTKEGKNVPMTGDDKNAAPALDLDPKIVNQTLQQSWACLEVTPNNDGSLDKKSLVQIVHRNAPTSVDPKVGRQALALITWANNVPQRVYAQIWFNLKYARTTPQTVGNGIPRHLFL